MSSRLLALFAVGAVAVGSGLQFSSFVGSPNRRSRGQRRAVRRAGGAANALQPTADLELIKSQNMAGHAMRELGLRLEDTKFQSQSLDGKVHATFDGVQRLREVRIDPSALEAAAGDRGALADAVLATMAEAYDKSESGSQDDVWQLYETNSVLLQAPLVQIGAGSTEQDLWANVTCTEETVKLATELFDKFDEDNDGFWNLRETSQVQLATEGTEMAEEAFNALIIAAAPDGGRGLTEEDLEKGLSKQQVVELYTDAGRQRQLGFVLNIYKDHAVACAPPAEPAEAAGGEGQAAAQGTSTSELAD